MRQRGGREGQDSRFDLVLRGGRVLDPARGIDAAMDVAGAGGRTAAVAPSIPAKAARRALSARDRLVIPGMIDTHAHVYEHVTGSFGLDPDLVGVRAGVTTVVDQGGAGPLTIMGLRKFIAEPAKTRVLAIEHGEWTVSDSLGVELRATTRLRPELTIRGGTVHRADSPLLLPGARRVA